MAHVPQDQRKLVRKVRRERQTCSERSQKLYSLREKGRERTGREERRESGEEEREEGEQR